MTIYGEMMGDMPEGKMNVSTNKGLKCNGYNVPTIVINYSFSGCQRDGKKIPGTNRVAYLPDT